jgi:hypothetical protein
MIREKSNMVPHIFSVMAKGISSYKMSHRIIFIVMDNQVPRDVVLNVFVYTLDYCYI